MIVRTPADIGAVIRERRKLMKLGQQQLAALIGVSRQWIIDVEKGKPRAEIGLMLRALDALGVEVTLGGEIRPVKSAGTRSIDLNAIIDSARRRK